MATFRIANWDEKQDTPYRVVYHEKFSDGTHTPDIYSGIIKANQAIIRYDMAAH
ncbi:hypothetical protein P4S68_10945 [Pseudoalteromonas sp. Hal099]